MLIKKTIDESSEAIETESSIEESGSEHKLVVDVKQISEAPENMEQSSSSSKKSKVDLVFGEGMNMNDLEELFEEDQSPKKRKPSKMLIKTQTKEIGEFLEVEKSEEGYNKL
jgi:hypothetical protein